MSTPERQTAKNLCWNCLKKILEGIKSPNEADLYKQRSCLNALLTV